MAEKKELTGPDLARGIPLTALTDGSMVQGHAKGEPILVARRGGDYFAIGAVCTHYGAPLVEGIIVDDTVRCPWHHACFSLRTGEALRTPALDPVSRWRVEEVSDSAHPSTPGKPRPGIVYVREKLDRMRRQPRPIPAGMPESII